MTGIRKGSLALAEQVMSISTKCIIEKCGSCLLYTSTLPDICGGIAFPEIVKHYRDGRVMLDRQKNPTRDVGTQYIRWFDEYAGDYFKPVSYTHLDVYKRQPRRPNSRIDKVRHMFHKLA